MMKTKRLAIGIIAVVGLLLGSLAAGAIFAGRPGRASAAPAAQVADPCAEENDGGETAGTADADNLEVECGPQDENETGAAGEANEVEDGDTAGDVHEVEDGHETGAADASDGVAPANTAVSVAQAQAIAEKANPGAATLGVEYDSEGGHALFEVELDNGLDVKVDAASGLILATEMRDAD